MLLLFPVTSNQNHLIVSRSCSLSLLLQTNVMWRRSASCRRRTRSVFSSSAHRFILSLSKLKVLSVTRKSSRISPQRKSRSSRRARWRRRASSRWKPRWDPTAGGLVLTLWWDYYRIFFFLTPLRSSGLRPTPGSTRQHQDKGQEGPWRPQQAPPGHAFQEGWEGRLGLELSKINLNILISIRN